MNFYKHKVKLCLLTSNKILVVAVILLLLTPLTAKSDVYEPSSKENLSTLQQSNNLIEQFNDFFSTLQNYIDRLKNEFSQGWGELNEVVQEAIDRAVGDLGIPDPLEAGEQIQAAIGEKNTNLVTTDPQLEGHNASHEWHQKYTKVQSATTLGKEGQKLMKNRSKASEKAVSSLNSIAEAAQKDDVTQKVMQKIAIQNAHQAIISKAIQGEEQNQTQSLASVNLNLADISERVSEQQKRQQFAEEVEVRQVLTSAGFSDGFWAKRPK